MFHTLFPSVVELFDSINTTSRRQKFNSTQWRLLGRTWQTGLSEQDHWKCCKDEKRDKSFHKVVVF